MTRFRPYPFYKDSGVEWLGKIPATWEAVPLGVRSRLLVPMRDKPPDFDGDIPWIRIEDFDGKWISDSKSGQRVSMEAVREMNLKVYPVGTVLCSCSCNMGATAVVRRPLVSNQTFIGIVPGPLLDSSFVFYLMQTAQQHLSFLASGAIQQYLSRNSFSRLRLSFPSIAEQCAIAVFLDHETQRIDALVEKKERLVELLREKRTALISHAVTKGLDPNVRLKDSGVEWLGKIPERWKVSRLKSLTSRIVDCPHATPTYEDDGEFPIVRTADVSLGRLDLTNARRVAHAQYLERVARLIPLADDILYTREGERFGLAALVPEQVRLCLGQRMMLFRAAVKTSAPFLMWALNADATYRQALVDTAGATSPHVDVATIINYIVAEPPEDEQAAIAEFLDQETARIDALVEKVRRSVELLKEYRTALISAAVTGKIDVRGTE